MLGLLALVAVASFGLSCLGWADEVGISVTCNMAGVFGLITQFILAMVANQSIYSVSPKR
jgi:hypothetical protein